MKIAIVTCYDQNDYIRARTLRTAFAAAPGVETLIIRNENKGLKRYIEVPLKILRARFRDKPDAYVITFRGYEMLLYMVLTLVRKPIIFDEMVNFTEWMVEHKIFKEGSLPYGLFRWWYGRLARHARIILADTEAHADYSAELNKLDRARYVYVPVATEESIFYPKPAEKAVPFTVFYYGHMLPLHGLQYVIDAALALKENQNIKFYFVGGKDKVAEACANAIKQGAKIVNEKWRPFEELPDIARASSLTLGGPFGNTTQAQYVVTGKTYQFLALGAPVLVGKNQVNEGFKDKVNCLMVPQADANALADAITWAYEHPGELKSIGQAGRKLYEEHLSQRVVNGIVAKLVQELQK
ncbi:MAG TPA: glycosyltransferase [Candidatus Saccharimonadales bacterium]|nr:glycosyltransferase [Candidatus Saccharimonadales bacterium]